MLSNRLNELSRLPENWDSYGAKPPRELSLQIADRIMANEPQPVPTTGGGIQLEWHSKTGSVEIEIGPDGRITGWARVGGVDCPSAADHIESLSQKHEALAEEVKAWRTDPELQGYESAATRKARAHTDSISALERSEG